MVSNAENWIRWGKKAIHESDVREHAGETGRVIPVEQWEQKPRQPWTGRWANGDTKSSIKATALSFLFTNSLNNPNNSGLCLSTFPWTWQSSQVLSLPQGKGLTLFFFNSASRLAWSLEWTNWGKEATLVAAFFPFCFAGWLPNTRKKKWTVNEPTEITVPGCGGGGLKLLISRFVGWKRREANKKGSVPRGLSIWPERPFFP